MSKTPESGYERAQDVNVVVSKELAPKIVGIERLSEISKKYGVSDKLMALMLDEQTSPEEKDRIFDKIVETLANAVLHTLIDPDDIEDVSAIIGPEWGTSKEDYLPFWNIKHAEEFVS